MFTPKQLQDFIDAPRALADLIRSASLPVPVLPRVRTSQPSTKTIIRDAVEANGRPATRVTRSPDGAVTVDFGMPTPDDGEARDASVVAFDRIAAMRSAR